MSLSNRLDLKCTLLIAFMFGQTKCKISLWLMYNCYKYFFRLDNSKLELQQHQSFTIYHDMKVVSYHFLITGSEKIEHLTCACLSDLALGTTYTKQQWRIVHRNI